MSINKSEHGRLVVFEGPDGVGKTTVAQALVVSLRDRGVACGHYAFPGQQEGTLGKHIYDLHHDPYTLGVIEGIHPVSMQVLHVAAHIDAIETQIKPAVEKGEWVVLDRYWWSTWAYGSLSGVPSGSRDLMISLERYHWGDLLPSIVFLVRRQTESLIQGLVSLYEELAVVEGTKYPVLALDNSGDLSHTVNRVLSVLGVDTTPAAG